MEEVEVALVGCYVDRNRGQDGARQADRIHVACPHPPT